METPNLSPGQIADVSNSVAQYISAQRDLHLTRAIPLTAQQKASVQGFFRPQLLDTALLLVLHGERVANPAFYTSLRSLGFSNLPDQSAMRAITFYDVVVSHGPLSNGLLFHELVHVEQYRQLAIQALLRALCGRFFAWRQLRGDSAGGERLCAR